MTISQSDKFLIEKLIEVRERGLYANGRDVTLIYNRVFNAHLSPTSCGSCIRTRINLLEKELRKQEAEEAKALEEQMKEAQAAAENKEVNEGKEEQNGSKRKSSKREKGSPKKDAD